MPLSQCNCEGCELKTLFFENVSNLEIESICSRKVEHHFKKGEIIITEGNPIEDFIYMKSGLVKLIRGSDKDKEQIICFAGSLDFVSLLSIFSETNYNYSVIALEDSVICGMKLDEVKAIAKINGMFALSLAEKINKASDKIIMTMLEVKQRRLLGRIAYMLLYFSRAIYKSHVFELPVSRKEIGEFIGMTTENVIRTLSDFRKDNIIKINGKTIEIIDFERLERIDEFS
jgi:CRP/FNR family transcriptional regulator